jgi:hypothetical protein
VKLGWTKTGMESIIKALALRNEGTKEAKEYQNESIIINQETLLQMQGRQTQRSFVHHLR